jgi:hypothetical protein
MQLSSMILCLVGSMALVVGCASRQGGARYRYVNSTQPKYDAYLTWSGYTGEFPDDPDYNADKVIYFYSGTEMGRGREGFAKVVNALEQLPPRSVLLIYPEYFFRAMFTSRSVPIYPPFFFYSAGFGDVVQRRQLTVVLSDFDHLGRPLAYGDNVKANATSMPVEVRERNKEGHKPLMEQP